MDEITREHPEYTTQASMWQMYRDLYAGGEQMKNQASMYLVPRQKEPPEVYGERLRRVFYENYAGSIIDWYAATLFRREPAIGMAGTGDASKRFFAEFLENCDLKGSSITDFLRERFCDALVAGTSHVLVDFPRPSKPVANRAEEDASGFSRAYLAPFGAEQLINWSMDRDGSYEWVVLRTSYSRQAQLSDEGPVSVKRWTWYDRTRFKAFEQEGDGAEIKLVDSGAHGLSKLFRVPVFSLKVSHGLWLMNKAAQVQMEQFNKSNALSWALTMGLFAQPVVYSDKEFGQLLGESYFLHLGPEDRFGWTEPEGKVYQLAAENLARLKDEIYRVCYLIGQAGQINGGPAISGLSKQRDFAITHEVLRAYGDSVKDLVKQLLRAVQAVREDQLTFEVTGLDEFDIGDFSAGLADAATLLSLGIQSPTLKREIFKRLAFQYLADSSQDTKDRIATEINSTT